MLTQDDLLLSIERYLATAGISPTAFGRKIAGDPNLVFDLRNGRSPQLRLVQKILAEIEGASS